MREKYLFDLLLPKTKTKIITYYKPQARVIEQKVVQEEKETFTQFAQRVSKCQKCPLHECATQVVFGEGNPEANLLLIGEAPGQQEDQQGLPFVGEAGQLLNKILAAVEIERSEVYITNVVKCRPLNNRQPKTAEIEACMPYLQQQIAEIKPKIIVCLGAVATQALLGAESKLTSCRGMWYNREGAQVMPTYHPAALLRDPAKKRPVWIDMQKVRDAYRALS